MPSGLDAAVAAFRATLERLERTVPEAAPSEPYSPPSAEAGELRDGGAAEFAAAVTVADAAGEPDLALDAEFGERAALLAVAGRVWRRHLGPLLTGADLQRLGRRSRQAVHDLVERRRLLALPGRGGRLYPAFQVDRRGRPRPGVPEVLSAFEGAAESPFTVASWFRTPQPLLDGRTPADWLAAGEDPEPMIEAARRTAARLRW